MNSYSGYPRVLIVGQGFNSVNGGGITLGNLFKDWPKSQLAVTTNLQVYVDFNACEKYYMLGSLEDYWIWPFSYIKRTGKISGPLVTQKETDNKFDQTQQPKSLLARDLFYACLDILGAEDLMRRLRISDPFMKWMKDFSPDLIYCQLSTLSLIRFVDDLSNVTNLPTVIHIMDDWLSTVYRQGLFSPYIRQRTDLEFRRLISRSTTLGISEAMRVEYRNRYQKEFTPFHNPVDIGFWIKYSKKSWNAGSPFRVRYGGRVGIAIWNSLIDFAKVIEEINNDGIPVVFDLYINRDLNEFINSISKYRCVNVRDMLPYEEVPLSMASADLLVIPYDFDEKSQRFARFSMPTKAVENMSSGTPILVYAPKDHAVTQYAQAKGWAFVVSERDQEQLKKGIQILIKSSQLREQLGRKAIETACHYHDANIVRNEFREKLIEAAKKCG